MTAPSSPLPGRATVLLAAAGLAEGPLLRADGSLLTVAADRGHVLRFVDGEATLFAVTGTGPNGLAEAADGSVYVAMCGKVGGRPRDGTPVGILAIRPSGRLHWITQEPVAPNDLCFGPDGLLYFSDPSRGRRDDGRIWRVDVATGAAELLASVDWYPNGIAFGLEDDAVYVADTLHGRIMRLPVGPAGLGRPDVAVTLDHGVPDGFAFDRGGGFVIATQHRPDATDPRRGPPPGDIQSYAPDGAFRDAYAPGAGHRYTNVALGADSRLVITSAGDVSKIAEGRDPGGSVLEVRGWPVPGLPLHPFRGAPGASAA